MSDPTTAFDPLLNALSPAVAIERVRAIAALDVKTADADVIIARIESVWRPAVETLNRIKPATWQNKLVPAGYNLLGEAVALGGELLKLLDLTAADLREARRAAITSGADKEFSANLTTLTRLVDMHHGKSVYVARLASRIQKNLVDLTDLMDRDELFSPSFVPTAVSPYGFILDHPAAR